MISHCRTQEKQKRNRNRNWRAAAPAAVAPGDAVLVVQEIVRVASVIGRRASLHRPVPFRLSPNLLRRLQDSWKRNREFRCSSLQRPKSQLFVRHSSTFPPNLAAAPRIATSLLSFHARFSLDTAPEERPSRCSGDCVHASRRGRVHVFLSV